MTLDILRLSQNSAVVAIASSLIAIYIGTDVHRPRQAIANELGPQVLADETIPTTVNSTNSRDFVIEGGTQAGTNLFHSFDRFSVPTGGAVHFNNRPEINIIFSRVTGGRRSDIDGLISANGRADLFLMNPSGIVFGANARLDIGGSFIATTAETIVFEDAQFSATRNTATPLLTMSAPVGLQFGASSQDIHASNSGHTFTRDSFLEPLEVSSPFTGLAVVPQQTLALLGQNIELMGGVLAANGHLELGAIEIPHRSSRSSASHYSTVTLQSTDTGWGFDYGNIDRFGTIQLSQRSVVDGSGTTPGSLHLQGQTLRMADSSVILMDNAGRFNDGDIGLDFSETIRLGETLESKIPSGIYSYANARGASAPIRIATGRLQLIRGGFIGSQTFSSFRSGNAGAINIQANRVEFVADDHLTLFRSDRGGVIMSRTFAAGSAGDIRLNVGQLRIFHAGAITANVDSGATGSGGQIQINAREQVALMGTPNTRPGSLLLGASSFGHGNSQGIIINTPRLIMSNGSSISSSSFAEGDAGSVEINASESIRLESDAVFLAQPVMDMEGSTVIRSATVQLERPLRQRLRLPAIPTGTAGMVILNTPTLEVADASQVSVQHDGIGNAGDIAIRADRVFLQQQGELTATTTSGAGGNINVVADDLLLMKQQGQINTEAGGDGDGGNIQIEALNIVGIDNSDIVATSIKGSGGNIRITTQGLFGLTVRDELTSGNDITASSNLGVNGIVQVTTPNVDPSSESLILPGTITYSQQQVATECGVTRGSRFRVVGRGGLPTGPTLSMSRDRPWHITLPDFGQIPDLVEGRPLDFPEAAPGSPPASTPKPPADMSISTLPSGTMQEATGMAIAPNGTLQLVASHTQSAGIFQSGCTAQVHIPEG